MIKIDHISFSYGGENENTGGVRDIDLNIEDGQFVVLCGQSGCGKTTVTRLINGLIPHYYEGKMTGEVWVNGAKVSEQPLYDTAAVVGSVFQMSSDTFWSPQTTHYNLQLFQEKSTIASQRHDHASFPTFYQLNAWLLIAANITSASITFLSI